jgi:hypothetical protein
VNKPKGRLADWSDAQIGKWIKYLISQNQFAFDAAGHAEARAEQRLVSNEEMVRCVRRGLLVRREQHSAKGIVEERATFSHKFASRPRDTGHTVAAISESYDDCVIVTFFWKKNR